MNRMSTVVYIFLIAAAMIGLIACNHPMAPTDTLKLQENTDKWNIHQAGSIENATSPPTMPTVIGGTMLAMDGRVIGILFSTPKGDICESRYGTPSGI